MILKGKTGSSTVIFKRIDDDLYWAVSNKWTLPIPYLLKIIRVLKKKIWFKRNLTQHHNDHLFYKIDLNDEQLIIEFYSIMIVQSTISKEKKGMLNK